MHNSFGLERRERMVINMKKRIISLIISGIMCMSAALPAFAQENWEVRSNNVKLRVGFFGDSHIGQSNNSGLKKAITAINELSGNKPDAYIGYGDVVWFDSNQLTGESNIEKAEDYYRQAREALDETVISGIPVYQVMGNHEFPLDNTDSEVTAKSKKMFIEKLLSGTDQTEENFTAEINGYSFVGASPSNYNDLKPAELENWIMKEIDKAIAKDSTNANADGTFDEGVIPNSTKPVFYVNHHPIKHSRQFAYNFPCDYSIDDTYTSEEFAEFLSKRPQVVSFYGHCHTQQQAAGAIYQNGSAIIGLPLISNGDGFSATYGAVTTWQTLYGGGQGDLLEVDENNVVNIIKYDLTTKEYIGEPWMIDIPSIVSDMTNSNPDDDTAHQLYSADKRTSDKLSVPRWDADAKIIITNMGTGSVRMHINHSDVLLTETPNQQDNILAGWHIILKDSYGAKVVDEYWDSGYYKVPAVTYTDEILEGLGYNNTYTLEVSPISVLGVEGSALTKTFTTDPEIISAEAVRFETENYCKKVKPAEYAHASGGKLCVVSQNKLIAGCQNHLTEDPSFSFSYTPEKTGIYDVEYVIGENNGGGLISTVKVSVDDILLGTNAEPGDEDMSMSGYNETNTSRGGYVWNPYIQMKKYKKSIELVGGRQYTVKFDISSCQNGIYLFATDYIQFTPRNVDIPEGKTIKNLLRNEAGEKLNGVSVSVGDFYGNNTPSYGNGYGGSVDYAIDGNDKTCWFPEFGHEYPYYQIDLGKQQNISKVRYYGWRGDNAPYWSVYIQIQASNYSDFRKYTTLKKVGSEGLDLTQNYEINLDPNINKYRYIRFVKGGGSNWGAYSITELDVFGYEGDDTSVRENLVETVENVTDGTVGLTNVKNVWVSNPWGDTSVSQYTYNSGKPIEIRFVDSVDMSTVNRSTVTLSKYDGTKLVTQDYLPEIDSENRTLKIDLSQLEQFVGTHDKTTEQYYQIDIKAGIQNDDGSIVNIPQAIKFTTHQIAKAPYVEGKEICDIAVGKSAKYKSAPKWGTIPDTDKAVANAKGLIGVYTNQYTNGGISGSSTNNNTIFTATTDLGLRYHSLSSDNPVLIDFGREYDIIGLAEVSGVWTFHYDNVHHYLLTNPTYETTGLSEVWNTGTTGGYTRSVPVSKSARYLLVKSDGEQFPYEIIVYAYVNNNSSEIYFTSPITFADDGTTERVEITANAISDEKNTLFLAQYDKVTFELIDVSMVKCENGGGVITMPKQDGVVYKMFLWDIENGLLPCVEAVTY